MKTEDTQKLADHLYDWLSKQKYGNEDLLHAAVCCDFAGMIHFKKAIARQIDNWFQEQKQQS